MLIVLAKHETKAEGGHSYVSKQFEQRFSLPSGVKPDKISSKLSKDGVLTVTAPRESLSITSGVKKGAAITSSGTGSVNSQSEETRADGLPHPRVSYDDDKFQISLDAKDYKWVLCLMPRREWPRTVIGKLVHFSLDPDVV